MLGIQTRALQMSLGISVEEEIVSLSPEPLLLMAAGQTSRLHSNFNHTSISDHSR